MSCEFKQEDTAEPHRRETQEPGHSADLRESHCLGTAHRNGGLTLRVAEQKEPDFHSLLGCLNMGGMTWVIFLSYSFVVDMCSLSFFNLPSNFYLETAPPFLHVVWWGYQMQPTFLVTGVAM